MKVEFSDEQMDGGMLYNLLDKHHLLPPQLEDANNCILASQMMNIGFLHDDGPKPLAIMLETNPEPGVIGLMFITERARLNQRRDELIAVSSVLRERWFNGFGAYRVESRIPVERTQGIRCLRHLGFRVETLPKGLRNAVVYNGKPVSLCVMSLLPSDPIKELSKDAEEPTLCEEVR